MVLLRPVGLEELRLIYEAGMRTFPPRLPEQPIFYPVLNVGYARQIAFEWNTKSGTLGGFVTRFGVDDDYVARFGRKVVGAPMHEELWVSAEELEEFNRHLEGPIEVIEAYFGEGYQGVVPDSGSFEGKDAHAQFVALASDGHADLEAELAANHVAVFLDYFFWQQRSFSGDGITDADRDAFLAKLAAVWDRSPAAVAPLGVRA